MPVEITMPKLGLTMTSGTIGRWLKAQGESVRAGEPLLEVSTDKITYKVEAPASGIVARLEGQEGDEFACGAVVGLIAPSDERDSTVSGTVVEAPRETPAAASSVAHGGALSGAHTNGNVRRERRDDERTIASPAARRLARERGVTIADVRGTGPRGRVTLGDVDAHVPQREPTHAPPYPQLTHMPAGIEHGEFPPQLPLSRRAIYRKMTEVGRLPLAHVEMEARVDGTRALMEKRRDFGWTAFAIYVAARLLDEHTDLQTNALTGAPFASTHIGFACDTPHGLIVPVVRDVDTLSLAEVEREVERLAAAAREAHLGHHDVGGACFSISNLGPLGIDRVAPLPDPPQTAILGLGAARERPAVVDGVLEPAWMLTCVLTIDHRFIDGAPASRFLAAFARVLTEPGVLL